MAFNGVQPRATHDHPLVLINTHTNGWPPGRSYSNEGAVMDWIPFVEYNFDNHAAVDDTGHGHTGIVSSPNASCWCTESTPTAAPRSKSSTTPRCRKRLPGLSFPAGFGYQFDHPVPGPTDRAGSSLRNYFELFTNKLLEVADAQSKAEYFA
jgi:hypothetical protein